MNPALPHATWRDLTLWLLRRYRRFRITGDSMLPLLVPGQEVLMNPHAYGPQPPAMGDLVVARHPHRADLRIIKRVEFVTDDGRCYLKGDNPAASSDSRQFGLVPQTLIQGKVVCLFP